MAQHRSSDVAGRWRPAILVGTHAEFIRRPRAYNEPIRLCDLNVCGRPRWNSLVLDLGPLGRLDLTFNSMLEHLLHGKFDVDPDVVGLEGFTRGDHVYSYWGIFGALIRLPLAFVRGGLRRDVTALSCWIAVWSAAAIKLKTLRLIRRYSPASSLRETLYWTLALSILFGGAQIQFLKPSIYQEVCLWAGVLAAIFVYFAVLGMASNKFDKSTLSSMAAAAGLALITRVSVGLGLYAALGLLLTTELCRGLDASIPARRPLS